MPWSVAFMVVMIVMITAIARVSREKYRAMGRGATVEDHAVPADLIASREEVRQLKERITVLERVITDNHGSSSDLSRQIDELRGR